MRDGASHGAAKSHERNRNEYDTSHGIPMLDWPSDLFTCDAHVAARGKQGALPGRSTQPVPTTHSAPGRYAATLNGGYHTTCLKS